MNVPLKQLLQGVSKLRAVHISENDVNVMFSITCNSVIAFTDIRFVIYSLKQHLNDKIRSARALVKSES